MTPTDITQPSLLSQLWSAVAGRSVRGRAEVALALLDGVLVVAAYAVLLLVRYDLAVPTDAWLDFRFFVPMALLAHLVANWVAGLYGPVWQHASMREAQQVLAGGIVASVGLTIVLTVTPRFVPLTVALLGGLLATGLFGIVRFQSRLFAYRRRGTQAGARVVIVGAGRTAAAILREATQDPNALVHPVALVDDDPAKIGRRIDGLPIAGRIDELEQVARDHFADQVLLAIPTADSQLVQYVADVASLLQVPLKTLPTVEEMVAGQARLRDIRDLSIDDILGRQQIETDLDGVRQLLQGKRVMVTGGGGSIGSEIVRQVRAFGPAALGILDRDETHIFDAAAQVDGRCEQLLVDVTDRGQLRAAFDDFRPDVVFHAAANKHVPLLESHACRAADTNVLGTRNVIEVAGQHGVEHLVFVSTDKAVDPANAMGASKRVGEQLVLATRPEGAAWSAVRFGNVLGSRGSVVPTFVRQIREGGPVTVTHEDMTRFFMSIPEAVQLVLQSAALARGGEIFMLDMGEPVRIMDLAQRMITLSGKRPGIDIQIDVTGLRPGEKLAEELHTPAEQPTPTDHPKIQRLTPPLLSRTVIAEAVARLEVAVSTNDDKGARELLFGIATEDRFVGTADRPQGGLRAADEDGVLVVADLEHNAA